MHKQKTNGNVLFISNDRDANDIWVYVLKQKGLSVSSLYSKRALFDLYNKEQYDTIIIDYYRNFDEALKILEQLRPLVANPILLLISAGEKSVCRASYAVGVDECIIKPIDHALFVDKVFAWLRRSWNVPTEVLEKLCIASFCLHPETRTLQIKDGSTVKLTNLEFRLMHLLMSNRGLTLEGRLIIDRVWGHSGEGDNTVLKNVVYRLRRKIEPDPGAPRYLQNSPGGYVFLP